MEKDKSEKKKWWMFFLSFGLFSAVWFFLFYFITKLIYHTEDAIFFFIPISAYYVFFFCALVYGLITWGFYFFIKKGIKKKSFQEFKVNSRLVLELAILPILISLPFLYLGITNAIVITEEKITFDTFWSFKNEEYFWSTDITGVEISYSISQDSNSPYRESFNGNYIIHFDDEKKIDLWANVFEGGISNVQDIDTLVQEIM
ncbi:hypothetical protein J7I80_05705 [Bacillus sp. ISL-41]|uniref:hypothetical protein n=1 Tax=Bacillus sp. ISL-41 TaxID=2819127 RepID=UPI001BE703E5|nr:hypothetical protein [Bacillus sp. ISL-41]MBT2641710.1 hypothetical protein [Bacillus sp. ISL-41]